MPRASSKRSGAAGKTSAARAAARAQVRVGFLGSRPLGAKILRWISTRRNVELVGAVAPPFRGWWSDTVAETARAARVPLVSARELFRRRPDVVFSVNYWKRLPAAWIRRPPLGVVNLHHSYNLRLRGRYSTSFAILRARRDRFWKHGSTLHYVTAELDRGPVIATRACPITERDTAETLFRRVEDLGFRLFQEAFERILRGRANTSAPARRSFLYSKSDGRNREAKPTWPPERLWDFTRAWSFPGRPRPFIRCNRHKIFLECRRD